MRSHIDVGVECQHIDVFVVCAHLELHHHSRRTETHYGVATVSRIDEIMGLFCRIASLL